MTLEKVIKWCWAYHNPETWIEYICDGKGVMYDHFMEKWNRCAKSYSNGAEFIMFYIQLDSSYSQKMEEYIDKCFMND